MWPFKKKSIEKASGGTWSGITNGWKPNWFQRGETISSGTALQSTVVYTCVSIIAYGIARLRLKHYTDPKLEGRKYLYKSDISKLLQKPNRYQNRMDFTSYLMMTLLLDGNAYAFAERDKNGKVIALHPLNARSVQVNVVPGSSEVWYSISNTNDLIPDYLEFVPASEIMHLRLFCPSHPLVGVTPLVSASLSAEGGLNIQDQSNAFFANKSKVGGYLRTPNKMTPESAKALSKSWSEGTNGLAAGKTALLDNDLSFESFTLNAVDAEVIAQYKLTITDIASAYHVPFHMVDPSAPHNFESAEAVARSLASSTFSFYIEYLEAGLDDFLGLDGVTNYVEFDVEAGIGRGDLKARMDAYSTAVHGGIMTPNDTRAMENLEPKDGGDDLFLQLQDRPLSAIEQEFKLKNEKTESEIEKLDAESGKIACETKMCENPIEPEPQEEELTMEEIQLMLDMEFNVKDAT